MVDLLLKSKTSFGVLLMVLAWLLGPETEPKLLSYAITDPVFAAGALLGGVGARDALQKMGARIGK